MNFLKTSLLSAIATVIKLASNLVINKIIAVYIGPSGLALIGQFQNLLSIITTLGNGAINSGVTKYVAEHNEAELIKRDTYISAAIKISLFVSIFLGLTLILSSNYISVIIMKSEEYHILFKVLGASLWLIALNTLVLSIINGLKRIRLFVIVNIVGSILSLILTSILTMKYNVWGALFSLIVVQALLFFISFPLAYKKLKLNFKWQRDIPNKYYKKLFGFSLMAIASIICASLTQILIRNHLIINFSLNEAGYWQSIWLISSMYLMVMTTALTTYYLPRLSELTDQKEIRSEILMGYKIIIPFVLISSISIYFSRDFIIMALFTDEFYPMRDLFLYQFLGDFLKMCSWILAFLMIAKSMTKTYIITEIIFAINFYLLTIYFTKINGLIGVVEAHAWNYLIYFILMVLLFGRNLIKNEK